MQGFGCTVIAHDIQESDDLKTSGISYKPLNELLQQSDIISLHCPLTPETHHLIKSDTLAKIKKGAMLINTSGGGLIKTADSIAALKSGQLGYLGIDVYEQEENLFFNDLSESIIKDDVIERLLGFHNVLITLHQGFLHKKRWSKLQPQH